MSNALALHEVFSRPTYRADYARATESQGSQSICLTPRSRVFLRFLKIWILKDSRAAGCEMVKVTLQGPRCAANLWHWFDRGIPDQQGAQ